MIKEITNSAVYIPVRGGETEARGVGGGAAIHSWLWEALLTATVLILTLMPTSASSGAFSKAFFYCCAQSLLKKLVPRTGGTSVTAISDCETEGAGLLAKMEGSKRGC